MAYGQPVSGLIEAGPVVPRQPPSTFEQITKYLSVSNALPGPIMLSHQPGLPVSGECRRRARRRKRRADQNGVGLRGVQRAVGLIGNVDRRKARSGIQSDGIEVGKLCVNDH